MDITLPYTATPGAATSASGVNSNLYAPATTATPPSSIEVINGQLDRANRAGAWSVPWDRIRSRALCRSDSVGATLNQDFFPWLFPQSKSATGAFTPVNGAGITTAVPRSGGSLRVGISLVEANSFIVLQELDEAFFGLWHAAPGSTAAYIPGSAQQICPGRPSGNVLDTTNRKPWRDRHYTWSYTVTSAAAGEHTFYVGLWLNGEWATVPPTALNDGAVVSLRCRVRQATTRWYR